MLSKTLLAATAFAVMTAGAAQATGTGQGGPIFNGVSLQGISIQGISVQGTFLQGIQLQGVRMNGAGLNVGGHGGVSLNGQVLAIEF